MKTFTRLSGFVLASTLALSMLAGPASQAEVDLQAAMRTETVAGDLKTAIKQYESVVAKYGKSDRAIAASALIHMAECYQKQGDSAERKVYEQVLRDYGDQTKAVTLARTRLARAADDVETSGMTSRRIWTPPSQSRVDFMSGATVSSDGRLLSFTDWSNGNLGVHEFATGRDRYLTNTGYPDYVEESAISRDGKQVAYSWFRDEKARYELRVVSLQGSNIPQSRVLFDNEEFDWLMPYDWSPDGNWIAVELSRKDHSEQFGLISVRDGSFRLLKSGHSFAQRLVFSPDGRYLGLDSTVGENRSQRDVFIFAVDGSRSVSAAASPANETMMGWSPDGKYLLFASDRGGPIGLWAVAVEDGKAHGTPELLKNEISLSPLGVSASGALYTAVEWSNRDIRIASVDFETGKLLTRPTAPIPSFVGTNIQPAWSIDGKYLAYRSRRYQPGWSGVLGILSLETGKVRELQPELRDFQNLRWMSDGLSIIVGGRPLEGEQGQYQIDLLTGKVTPVSSAPGFSSLDGKKAYYRKGLGSDGVSFVERDLGSGQEREIIRQKEIGFMNLSPDGRWIATTGDNRSTVLLIPVNGDKPRELLRATKPLYRLAGGSWMADSKALLIIRELDTPKPQTDLLLVPIDGSPSRRIDIGADWFEGPIRVHPDGRRVAYVSGERKQEVWVLENFLPRKGSLR